eukprot:CAMPEP_0175734268 /NCGR_PEP_ID=MMETSP0097-20121207/52305_1 /TAXON_ID=311494 /ORGANISM="Alexandrium monilatum, Strain CCMP3105" /LENGTH=68 /DNA_ID=CAMNT_0017042303 /DNA_START=10 /DNA_END=212 /DNA_ORIENTATION=-
MSMGRDLPVPGRSLAPEGSAPGGGRSASYSWAGGEIERMAGAPGADGSVGGRTRSLPECGGPERPPLT